MSCAGQRSEAGWAGGGSAPRERIALTYNQMVVGIEENVDELFHALADPTRRDILRRSATGEASVSRLAELYPMSFAAVQKHVAVLDRAGLVVKERRGREQRVRANPDGVRQARHALDQLELAWRERVDRMSDLLAEESGSQSTGGKDG